jgi:hypothetical protein
VFLPGIGGSVLQTKDGEPLWAPSVGVAWRFFDHPEPMLAQLRLDGDDPEREILDDGVRPISLLPDVHLIPRLWNDVTDKFGRILALLQDTIGN